MTDVQLPTGLIEGRRTPRFATATLPEPLATVHRTTVWAELIVEAGTVGYVDMDEPARAVRLEAPESIVIAPGVAHQIEPSTDAVFFVQFYRSPDAPLVPGPVAVDSRRRSGPWELRGRDLDDPDEIVEMVTRQYVDVVQDDLLAPYFTFGPGFIDWQAHIGQVADYWCHVLLFAPGYEIDTIESHRHLHDQHPFTPDLFDRWLQVFIDTVEGGWRGPNATIAVKRATGMAWAMAQRYLGHGAWRPPQQRAGTDRADDAN
jgi:hemoglobin